MAKNEPKTDEVFQRLIADGARLRRRFDQFQDDLIRLIRENNNELIRAIEDLAGMITNISHRVAVTNGRVTRLEGRVKKLEARK